MAALAEMLESEAALRTSAQRCAFWTTQLPAALETAAAEGSLDVTAAAAALAAAVMSTVDVYFDKASQAGLLAGLRAIASRADVGEPFARMLLSAAIGGGSAMRRRTPAGAAQLLCACCAVAEAEWAKPAGPLPAPELFPLLGLLLHATRGRGDYDAAWRLGLRAVRRLLAAHAASSQLEARAEEWLLAQSTPELAEAACCLACAVAPAAVRRERARAAPLLRGKRAKGEAAPAAAPFDPAAWAKALASHLTSTGIASPSSAVAAFTLVLRSGLVPLEVVEKYVLPALGKAIKRSAEAGLPCVESLFSALPPGATLSPAAAAALAELLAPMLAARPTAAAAAVSAVASLRLRLTPAGASAAVAALIAGSGKASQLSPPQRIALSDALGSLATVPLAVSPRSTANAAAAEAAAWADGETAKQWATASQAATDAVAALLLPLAARETEDAPRTAMMGAVSRWVGARGVATAEGAVAAIGKGLGDKSAEVRRAHVAAVLGALRSAAEVSSDPSSLRPALAALLVPAAAGDALLSLAKNALKKAPAGGAARADALGALAALREGSVFSPALAQAVAAEKVWAQALKAKESFVWVVGGGGLSSLPSGRELGLTTRFVVGLALSPQLALCGDGGALLLDSLLGLCVSPHAAARLAALHALRTLGAKEPSPTAVSTSAGAAACWAAGVCPARATGAPPVAAAALLKATEAAVRRLTDAADAANADAGAATPDNDDTEGEAASSSATAASVLASASHARAALRSGLARLRDPSCTELAPLLPRLLLLTHQPALQRGSGRPSLWASFCFVWGGAEALPALLPPPVLDEVAALLASDRGAAADKPATRAAALAAFRSLATLPRSAAAGPSRAVAEALLSALLPLLEGPMAEAAAALGQATPAEVRALQTETETAAAVSANSEAAPTAPRAAPVSGKASGKEEDDVEAAIRATFQRRAAEAGKAAAPVKKAGGGIGGAKPKLDKMEAQKAAQVTPAIYIYHIYICIYIYIYYMYRYTYIYAYMLYAYTQIWMRIYLYTCRE